MHMVEIVRAKIEQLKTIHREYRTVLLNVKYYNRQLRLYRMINLWMEILIAVGSTTSTGIAGFAIWQNGLGTTAWGIVSGASIMLAVVKPIIKVPERIERYGKLSGEYSTMFEKLSHLEDDIRISVNRTGFAGGSNS